MRSCFPFSMNILKANAYFWDLMNLLRKHLELNTLTTWSYLTLQTQKSHILCKHHFSTNFIHFLPAFIHFELIKNFMAEHNQVFWFYHWKQMKHVQIFIRNHSNLSLSLSFWLPSKGPKHERTHLKGVHSI